MKLFLLTIIFVVVSLCVPLGIRQADSAFAGEAKASGETEWTKTVAAAKKEGKLAVFLYQRENIESAAKAFEKKFPEIQVTVASTPAAETGPRIMAERRAGKYLWDICICGPTTPYAILYPAKALDPSSRRWRCRKWSMPASGGAEIIITWIPKGAPSSFSWAPSICPACITTRTPWIRKNSDLTRIC
jgi:hypothetical protein